MERDWRAFVVEHGWRARRDHLAYVLGQPVTAVDRACQNGACKRLPRALTFSELFTRWHGRPPAEADWPPPVKRGRRYEWQEREVLFAASLEGSIGTDQILRILTARLQKLTGDPTAQRRHGDLQRVRQRTGLQAGDLVGGMTTREAAKRAGITKSLIHQEIRRGRLRTFRIGHRHVITERAFHDWQAPRLPAPPKGWVKLWDLERHVGISVGSSRLSWYAKQGLIPGAVFCAGHRWWIAPERAAELRRRFRAGLPMPWHGRYTHPSVTRRSHDLWRRRRHEACAECRAIWKRAGGEPASFADFHQRWPGIPERDKRHLTAPDGLSATKAAESLGMDKHTLTAAIAARELEASKVIGRWVIRRAALRKWLAGLHRRGAVAAPTTRKGYDVLTFKHAASRYWIDLDVLLNAAEDGRLPVVPRHNGEPGVRPTDVARLFAGARGLSLADAAHYARISKAQFLASARARGWRPGEPITQRLAHEVRTRQHKPGWLLTYAEAARRLKRSVAWVRGAIAAGLLRPLRGVDRRQIVLGRKAVDALIRKGVPKDLPRPKRGRPIEWLQGEQAADHAGVTISTVKRWHSLGRLVTEVRLDGTYYAKSSVERAATQYWATCRFKRAMPPAWLQQSEAA